MIRDRHKAIRIALASLCALAVALVAALAITVSLSDFDLQQSSHRSTALALPQSLFFGSLQVLRGS